MSTQCHARVCLHVQVRLAQPASVTATASVVSHGIAPNLVDNGSPSFVTYTLTNTTAWRWPVYAFEHWYNGTVPDPAALDMSPASNPAALRSTRLALADASAVSVTSSISLSWPGVYTAYTWLVDSAGNWMRTSVAVSVMRNNATLPASAFVIAGGQEGLSPSRVNVTVANPRGLSLASDLGHWPMRVYIDWYYDASSGSAAYNLSAPAAELSGPGAGMSFATLVHQYVVPGARPAAVMVVTSSGLVAERIISIPVRSLFGILKGWRSGRGMHM